MGIISESYASYFDNSKYIDRDNWGVTLITSSGSGLRKHHAQILIEMVSEAGEYKKVIVELLGGGSSNVETKNRIEGSWCASYFGKIGKVQIIDKPEISDYGMAVKHSGHSETWIRSADTVQSMLNQAKNESVNYLANPRPFNIFGRNSKFAPPVKVYRILDPSLQQAYNQHRELLIRTFETAKKYKTPLRNGAFSAFLSTIHGGTLDKLKEKIYENNGMKIFLRMCIPACLLFVLPTVPAIICEISRKHTFRKLESYLEMAKVGEEALSTFSVLDEGHVEEYNAIKAKNDDIAIFLATENMIEKLFNRVLAGMSEEVLARDNCCTWALEKLAMVDVDLRSDDRGQLITDTRDYLSNHKFNTELL